MSYYQTSIQEAWIRVYHSKADAPSAQTPSVLMVDASGRPQSHARRDIPVLTSIVDSQVKVICHSPRGKKSQTRQEAAAVNSGNTRQAASIKVERVPHVNVMDTSAVSTGNQSLSEQSKGIYSTHDLAWFHSDVSRLNAGSLAYKCETSEIRLPMTLPRHCRNTARFFAGWSPRFCDFNGYCTKWQIQLNT